MIVGRESNMYVVAEFVTGLRRAMRGIVRVTVESTRGHPSGYATGWLITDELVVTPDFVVSAEPSEPESYVCHHVSSPEPIPAELVLGAQGDTDGSRPVLLRLARPLRRRALPLEARAADAGDQVVLLHYPEGKLEPHLSVGRVEHVNPPWIGYDADTSPGSSGAPVLGANWAVVAMHTRSTGEPGARMNEGVAIATQLEALRDCPEWAEIARKHKLADVTAARRKLGEAPVAPPPADDEGLLAAAVRWSFDPKKLPRDAVAKLRPLVPEPSVDRWVLPGAERERLLRSADSLGELREARGSSREGDPRQEVIDRILDGPPYSLDEIAEDSLPHWLQATRWFADVVPSLPTPADVNRALEQRRVRSRLEDIGGENFRGRTDELRRLREWYDDPEAGPMVVTGIGGVGKSALVARSALNLPEDTLLLWLDFDRADVAPDDPVSVLRLLFEQLTTQLEGFSAPELDASSWEEAVAQLGGPLAPHLDAEHPPVLVLDGFEVAQHVKRHREIWELLELLLPEVPGLRVLVSGRAPVADLELHGRKAQWVHLEGLEDEHAAAWLRDAGITDDEVVARVVGISRGIPLVLRLAVRWTQTGGEVDQLPDALPIELVEGFLYQRILDRVIDPVLKPVARDALVLRRLTAEMLPEVLGDTLPEGLETDDIFARISQEMALVGDEAAGAAGPTVALPGTGVLRLLPEVRAATLRLLETDAPDRVRTIDERAAVWYAKQDLDDVANAAELVYHRLRLGDVKGAEQAWREECAPLLLYAEEELPADAEEARGWLRASTVTAAAQPLDLASWENDAGTRVRDHLARGLLRSIPAILAERAERGPESPLVLYDAWSLSQAGDVEGARKLLEAAPPATGLVARDRALLAAWLAGVAGDRREADWLLATIADAEQWSDRENPTLDALTVSAARVRLTVDLASELELLQLFEQGSWRKEAALDVLLPPADVVLYTLSERVGGGVVIQVREQTLRIPLDPSELGDFALAVDRARMGARRGTSSLTLSVAGPELQFWHGSQLGLDNEPTFEGAPERVRELALDLAVLGWRRWVYVTRTLFLAEACEQALQLSGEPQWLAMVGTLAAFRGPLALWHDKGGPLPDILDRAASARDATLVPPPTERQAALAKDVLGLAEGKVPLELLDGWALGKDFVLSILRALYSAAPWLLGPALYLLWPDPLDVLLRQALGVPDTLQL